MRKLILQVLLLCFLALPALADGVNRALLIGCDSFLTMEDTAPSSANNVALMSSVLQQSSLGFRRIVVADHGASGGAELERLILLSARGAEEGDTFWFYLSTHGLPEDGVSFLISNGQTQEAVSAARLKELFDRIPGRKVLIFDACHSGAAIGKGTDTLTGNLFAGSDCRVICSAGGAESSWFWSGGETGAGAGYFSGSLAQALGPDGGWAADINRDGVITMTELAHTLPGLHGASTPRFYPEEDSSPLLTYDLSGTAGSGSALITGLTFDSDLLSGDEPSMTFSYTLTQTCWVGYQLIYRDGGAWCFDEP